MSGKVLITGHQGYIGSIMAPIIQSAGYQVFGLDTGYYGENCIFIPETSNIPCINKDIRDVSENDLEGFDAIIHLAALSNDPLSNLRPEWTYDINHKAQGSGAFYSLPRAACMVLSMVERYMRRLQ